MQGAKSLAFGLRGNITLQRLDVSNCSLDDSGIELILKVLSADMTNDENEELRQSADNALMQDQQGLFNLIETINRTGVKSVAPR